MVSLECQEALGVENGQIPDRKISASSQWDANHTSEQGRLHFQASGRKVGAWCAGRNDYNQWLQADLGSQFTRITGVASQGRNGAHRQWVTKYKLLYSNDGINFTFYRAKGQMTEKVKYTIHCLLSYLNHINSYSHNGKDNWTEWSAWLEFDLTTDHSCTTQSSIQ